MKKFKKLTALVLAFLMMTVYVPVMAEETGVIQGDVYLYAPPAGVYSVVPYTLYAADGTTKIENATWTMNKEVAGITLNSSTGELVLSGSEMTSSDSFTLSATTETVSASTTITIPDYRLYETFDNQTIGEQVKVMGKTYNGADAGTGLHNVKVQVGGTEENKYASTTAMAGYTGTCYQNITFHWSVKHKAQGTGAVAATPVTGTVTAGFRMYINSAEHQIKENNGASIMLYLGSNGLKHRSGTASDYTLINGTALNKGDWADVYISADYYNGKYSVYLNGSPVLTNADLRNKNVSYQTISNLVIYSSIDNVTYFSGEPFVPEAPYDIEGTDTIYLPGDNDAATIQYVLKNKDDNSVVSDAIYSVSGTGVEMLSDGRLLVNKNTTPGKITISAYSPTETYQTVVTKEVTVQSEKWFYDFESYTVGGTPSLTSSANDVPTPGKVNRSWGNIEHTIVGETDSNGEVKNKYYGFSTYKAGTSSETAHQILNTDSYFGDTTTVEFDFLIEDDAPWHWVLKEASTAGTNMEITYNMNALTTAYNKDGVSKPSSFMIEKGWHHIRAEFDYESYSIWIDGTLWLDDYLNKKATPDDATSANNKGFLDDIYWGSPVDNLSIYTGSNYNISASTSATELTVPGTGTQTYDFTSVYSDGASISKALTYTLADEYTGVSLSGNTLSIASTAEMVPVTVNVTDGFVYGSVTLHTNKNYVLVNDALYAEGSDVINAADSYTIKAGYGSSKNKANYTLYIAQYEGGELVDLIPVSVSEDETLDLTAEYSGDFSATGFARVFLWDEGLVPVRADITVQ